MIHIENFNLISSIVFDIFTPKKGKKNGKKAILEIFKSLIKSKRFELQGKEMARKSIIYVLILCKKTVLTYSHYVLIYGNFSVKKIVIFYGLQKFNFF